MGMAIQLKEYWLYCWKLRVDNLMGNKTFDFVVENGENSTHILNAISPAFTSSFAFAEHVVTNYIEKREN